MVRLARGNESLLVPFVDSKGNFGKVYSSNMAYAAPRYTEVKLDAICSEIFADIDSRRAFRPTDNSLRINTNIGYQAWKKLYYSTNVEMSTKIVPQYNSGTDVCNSDFMSPFDMNIGVGLNKR